MPDQRFIESMPDITICKNPFRPQLDRVEVSARTGTRLDTVLRREGMIVGRGRRMVREHTFVVQVNGEWLLQAAWARRLKADDVVLVALLPGKGGGGSNPLQIVAMVALAVATAGAAAAWGPALGAAMGLAGTTATAVGGAIIGSAIMIGGSMLLSALFPPAKPPSTMAREQASPTYTIGAQGNMARLMESIPVQYGRFRVYPDFAAQPYTELDSNQTYLYQLFCLGQGEYDIEEVRIEDTPIGNFEEVQYEVIPPGGAVTLFPDNVVTSNAVQGVELKGPNEEGHVSVGPFVANPAGTKTNKLAVDIVFPAGLFYANDDGGLDSRGANWTITAHPIDDDGNSAGSAFTLGNESYSNATNTPQMMTYRYDVPEGRYSVSAIRTSEKDMSSRAGNTLQWGGLRAYLPSTRNYGDVTLLATIIRATNNLNQSTARRINVIGTRKLRTWHPVSGWSSSTMATRNPAWALADVCKNAAYGRGLRDSRINLTALYRLAQIWADRGDTFDGVFDTATTLWDALTRIARVGRAMPMYYAGVIDFIRNEPKTVKTQMFTPMNIVTNTFSVDYVFPEHDSPDHVIVEFINEDTWQEDEVVCALPGSAKLRPFRLQVPGIVKRAQAWREGISLAAQNRDQRRFVSLQTELEGNIPRYGDLVEISHDVPAWGLTGFTEDYDPATRRLTTSEPLKWWPGENHYINLRKRDGSPDGPYRVTAGSHDREMVIADPIDGHSIYVSDGQGEEFTHYQFGPGERRSLLAQVLSAAPDEQGRVSLDFVNYAPSVHTAETGGAVPPPNPSSLLPMMPNAPIVDNVTVYASPTPGQQVISATPARGAERYEFRASGDMGASWIDLGTYQTNTISGHLQAGPWRVQARGIGAMHGPWATWNGIVSATMAPPPMLEALTATPLVMGIRWDWVLPAAPWMRSVELWQSPTPNFGDAALIGEFRTKQLSFTQYGLRHGQEFWMWARIRDDADQPGPWFPDGEGVRGQSSTDSYAIQDYITQEVIESALGQVLWNGIESIPDMQAQLDELTGAEQHDPEQAYLAGAVVLDSGKMYRAKQDVPAQTPITDEAYWQYIGDYDSIMDAVAGLSLQVREQSQKIEEIDGTLTATATATSTLVSAMRDVDDGSGALADALNEWESRAWIREIRRTTVTKDKAEALVEQQVGAQLGGVKSEVEELSYALAESDGKAAAMRTIKVSIDNNGTMYAAAMGLSIENDSGVVQSQFVVIADRFVVMTAPNGTPVAVFTIDNGQVIINTAIIDKLHGNKILTNTLDANRITTDSFVAKLINVDTAYIKTGNIQNLAVDTLKIAGRSVTISGSAYAAEGYRNNQPTVSVPVSFYLPAAAQVTVYAVSAAVVRNDVWALYNTVQRIELWVGGVRRMSSPATRAIRTDESALTEVTSSPPAAAGYAELGAGTHTAEVRLIGGGIDTYIGDTVITFFAGMR